MADTAKRWLLQQGLGEQYAALVATAPLVGLAVIDAFLNANLDIYQTFEMSKRKNYFNRPSVRPGHRYVQELAGYVGVRGTENQTFHFHRFEQHPFL